MTAVLDGKAALVIGGSRGIGADIAVGLAEAGANVALTYVNGASQASDTVARIKDLGRAGLALQADSADPARVSAAVDETAREFGALDILVNNAAVGHFAPVEELTPENVDEALNINARGPFFAAQSAAKYMHSGGRIINIGSCITQRVPFPGMSLYSMSKSTMTGLTKGLARELGPRGITVNQVHPGPIETDMNPAEGPAADLNRNFLALGHYGKPWDISATVTHLAGEEGRFITGASIDVDGGFAT